MALAQENEANMDYEEFEGVQSDHYESDIPENRGQILHYEGENISKYGRKGRLRKGDEVTDINIPMPGSVNLDLKKEEDESGYPETPVGANPVSGNEEENEIMNPTGPPPPPDPPDLPINSAIHVLFLGGLCYGAYQFKSYKSN